MENTNTPNQKTQTTAEAILHFSSFVIVGESDKKHFLNPVVVNYALSYILRAIKENQQNPEFSADYKEVFWYIANTFKKS